MKNYYTSDHRGIGQMACIWNLVIGGFDFHTSIDSEAVHVGWHVSYGVTLRYL